MTDLRKPNFMVIGAQKCGTTWLSRMVRQHPDVFAPEPKELHFFNRTQNYEKGIDHYWSLFAGAGDETAVGEFTPNYLWNSPNDAEALERGVIQDPAELIHTHLPNVRFIVCLRDPVARAVSAYTHFIRTRRVSPRQSILEVAELNGIRTMGYYREQIAHWYRHFSPDQFLFHIYETDIAPEDARLSTLQRTYEFLGVDGGFAPPDLHARYNVKPNNFVLFTNYYSPFLARALPRLIPPLRTFDRPAIDVSAAERAELAADYRVRNEGLDDLIGRSLPW